MAVGRFTLAVNRAYQKGDVKADFLNMVAFGKTAENIQGIKPWNDRTVEEREIMLKERDND